MEEEENEASEEEEAFASMEAENFEAVRSGSEPAIKQEALLWGLPTRITSVSSNSFAETLTILGNVPVC